MCWLHLFFLLFEFIIVGQLNNFYTTVFYLGLHFKELNENLENSKFLLKTINPVMINLKQIILNNIRLRQAWRTWSLKATCGFVEH